MKEQIVKLNEIKFEVVSQTKNKKIKDSAMGDGHVLPEPETESEDEPDEDDQPLVIKGYANRALPDRMNEVMPQSCWDLTDYNKNPVVCINHQSYDINCLVGTSKVEARPEGLYFEAEIGNPQKAALTPMQVTTRSLIKQGYLKGVSVGFIPLEADFDEKTQLLTYKKAQLTEFSLVTVPMQQDSLVSSYKSFVNTTKDNSNVKELKEEISLLKKEVELKNEKLESLEKSVVQITKQIRQIIKIM
jgi:HK97 family phage prohead protease